MNSSCLNCNENLLGPFCYKCGQKASTHRITFSKFVQHDLVHGIFHVDKGIFYTLKKLLHSPGYAVRSFISGKRVMHYNIFALFIIIVAAKTVFDSYMNPVQIFDSYEKDAADASVNRVIGQYYKFFYLLYIPILSVFTYLFFKRLHYNYTEHVVLNCFILTGAFFYGLVFAIIGYFWFNLDSRFYSIPIMILYLFVGYYQATRESYKPLGLILRSLVIILLFLITFIVTLFFIISFMYGSEFNGRIAI